MNSLLLNIEATKRTPRVCFKEGKLYLVGRSIIENPSKFYDPIFYTISQYLSSEHNGLTIYFAFEHINTGSVKWLYVLLKDMLDANGVVSRSSVNWVFEKDDDDMEELGCLFQSLVSCEFSVIQIDSISEFLIDQE